MRPERKYYGKTIKSGVFLCSYKIFISKEYIYVLTPEIPVNCHLLFPEVTKMWKAIVNLFRKTVSSSMSTRCCSEVGVKTD